MAERTEAASTRTNAQPGSAEAGLGFLLGSAHRALRSAWEASIVDLGLTAPQALVLRLIAEGSGVGLRELARRMRTDAMNAKRLADGLEAAGLVRSEDDPDHRQRRLLCVTVDGRHRARQVAERARAWEEQLAERLESGALTRLRSLLQELEEALAAEPDAVVSGAGTPPVKEDPA